MDSVRRLCLVDELPAWNRAAPFLQRMITDRNARTIADIGGGANPMLNADFIQQEGLDYSVMDISESELAKAGRSYKTIAVDVAAPLPAFCAALRERRFDFIFSHMLFEHLADTHQAHANLFEALAPGGICIHLFPSPNSLPLLANRIFPESVSGPLLRMFLPNRDLDGRAGKFPAYYDQCGAPNAIRQSSLESLGYKVLQYVGYIGHGYYERYAPLASAERWLRKQVLAVGLPFTSYCMLMLERPTEPAARETQEIAQK